MLGVQRCLYAEPSGQLKSFATGIDPSTLSAGIGMALLFGPAHAFMPGHGRTALVSYFLGRPSEVVAGLSASIILVLTTRRFSGGAYSIRIYSHSGHRRWRGPRA
jgi:ABC-type nickel/cobalt efflux system permease component RcnA